MSMLDGSPRRPQAPTQPGLSSRSSLNSNKVWTLRDFPRSNWNPNDFRSPPITNRPELLVDRARWAAHFASKAWQEALDGGNYTALESPVLFKLAVLDKVFELHDYCREQKVDGLWPIPWSTERWGYEVVTIMWDAYDIARQRAPSLESMAPLYRNVLSYSFKMGLDAVDVPPVCHPPEDPSSFGDFDPMYGKYQCIRPNMKPLPPELLQWTRPSASENDHREPYHPSEKYHPGDENFKHISQLVQEGSVVIPAFPGGQKSNL